jgi:hypothetical protein
MNIISFMYNAIRPKLNFASQIFVCVKSQRLISKIAKIMLAINTAVICENMGAYMVVIKTS